MKAKNHLITIVILAILAAPSLTYASWWNPFSWFKKTSNPPKVMQVEVSTTTSTTTPQPNKEKITVKPNPNPQPEISTQSSEIENLRKEVEQLKKKNPVVAIPKPTKPSSAQQSFNIQETTLETQKRLCMETADKKYKSNFDAMNSIREEYTQVTCPSFRDFNGVRTYSDVECQNNFFWTLENAKKIYNNDIYQCSVRYGN